MHTGILLAVEAENAEEALAIAEEFSEGTSWSDWNEHNGRWAGEVPNGILCYKDDPEEFMRIVDNYIASTDAEEIDLIKAVGHLSVEELVSDPRYSFRWDASEEEIEAEKKELAALSDEEKHQRSMEKLARWQAAKLLRMGDDFSPETHFWDVAYGYRYKTNLMKRIKEKPEKQFIVMWDFHF